MVPALVEVLRVQALLKSNEEDWDEAEQAILEALMLCRRMTAPYAEAKVLYTAGLVARQRRALEMARQRFKAVLTILEYLGERLYTRRIEDLLGQEKANEQKRSTASPGVEDRETQGGPK